MVLVAYNASRYWAVHIAGTSVGDIIKVTVEAIPRGKVKKGQVMNALVVRTKKGIRRPAVPIKFDGNAAVLLNANNAPIGTYFWTRDS